MRRAAFAVTLALASLAAGGARAQHGGGMGEGDPHAGVEGAPHAERSLASAEASAEVPAGTIRVRVVDGADAPVANAEVNVGVMGQEGRRDRVHQRTDASGVAFFRGLETGTDQAYRVNVLHQGATYSSTPFQLPPAVGYDVRITRLPTTHEDRVLLQLVDMQIELRESRAHVVTRVQLLNLGAETYVFPVRGLRYTLPQAAIAFQTEPVMTDQHVTEHSGTVEIHGSLPPGGVVLPWGFDVPLSGPGLDLSFPVSLATYQVRVITDAPDGLTLDVETVTRGQGAAGHTASQFSRPQAGEVEGRSVLFTDLERTPQDPRLERVVVQLSGIPTPGPLRWIAVIVASLLLALFVGLSGTGVRPDAALASQGTRGARKKELLVQAAALGREHASGEVGPKFFARRRAELVSELALLMRADEEAKATMPAARPAGAAGVRKAEARPSRTK